MSIQIVNDANGCLFSHLSNMFLHVAVKLSVLYPHTSSKLGIFRDYILQVPCITLHVCYHSPLLKTLYLWDYPVWAVPLQRFHVCSYHSFIALKYYTNFIKQPFSVENAKIEVSKSSGCFLNLWNTYFCATNCLIIVCCGPFQSWPKQSLLTYTQENKKTTVVKKLLSGFPCNKYTLPCTVFAVASSCPNSSYPFS